MSKYSDKKFNRLLLILASLLLAILTIAVVIGYKNSRNPKFLPLPETADISRIDFCIIEVGYTPLKWYSIPLQAGNVLVDFFRDSVVDIPKYDPNIIDVVMASPQYGVRITEKRGKEFSFFFAAEPHLVHVLGSWANGSFYIVPDSRFPQLKAYVQFLFTTKWIADGQYPYLPGESSYSHYFRIRSLILNDTNSGPKKVDNE